MPKLLKYFSILCSALCLALSGCKDTDKKQQIVSPKETVEEIKKITDCNDCHALSLDLNHNIPCANCHNGNQTAGSKEEAHRFLEPHPASPDNMKKLCGECHASQVELSSQSKHFTLQDEINIVRSAFGATTTIEEPQSIPHHYSPETPLELADDMLRRRCLRCHVYYKGDDYPGVRHGTGCASCHLKYENGKLTSHKFVAQPDDKICLSCHYSNHVGADYYGLFEHDYHWDYQTPQTIDENYQPEYGVNTHQLRPDIHQTAGIACIDCHSGNELMGLAETTVSCESCHALSNQFAQNNKNIQIADPDSNNKPILHTKISKKALAIPQMSSKNHTTQGISCHVCHAQWSFADYGTHLLRGDNGEYYPWTKLTQQGSSEIEKLLDFNLYTEEDELPPVMRDKFTGQQKPGIWLKGYEIRRWEEIPTCTDDKGVLQVCRPILDIHITYVNEDDDVIIDAAPAKAPNKGMLPYAPHTIGKAGAYRGKTFH